MFKRFFMSVLFVILLIPAGFIHGQEQDESMKKWMEYMTPGKEHEMMGLMKGNWKADLTMFMAPGAEPMKMEATATVEMILGGRYQQMKYSGNMMGMPFEGIGITAFDNATKKFYSSWIDNMGTGLLYCTGTGDEKTGIITQTGDIVDPMTGQPSWFKQETWFDGKDTGWMKMYQKMDGKEFMSMEIKLTRMQ